MSRTWTRPVATPVLDRLSEPHVLPESHGTVPPQLRARARLALVVAAGYGTLRLFWVLGERPWLPPSGDDLLVFSDWGVVALCAAAVLLAVVFARRRNSAGSGWLAPAGAVVTFGLLAASSLLLLDVVGLLLPGLGVQFHLGAFLSRLGCLTVALTLASTSTLWRRHDRDRCLSCGRDRTAAPLFLAAHPAAVAAAYAVVLACLTRVGAQVVAGHESNDLLTSGVGALFVVGAVLAGTLLPLALVHRWGLVWPAWTGPLAGHRVPRWLVLGPGLFVGVGMTVYFATTALALLTEGFEATSGGLSASFMAVSVTAYLVWGVCTCVAAASYRERSRPPCRVCGLGSATSVTRTRSSTGSRLDSVGH
jgi:hypothetical protein